MQTFRWLISYLIFLISCVSYASFYTGVGIGGLTGQFKITSSTTVFPSNAFFADQLNNPITSTSQLIGNFFIGYLFPLKNIVFAPEAFLTLSNPKSHWVSTANLVFPVETLTTLNRSELSTLGGGVEGRLGFNLNASSLLYARLGVSFNKLNAYSNATISRPDLSLTTQVYNPINHHYSGLRAGLGLEQNWTRSLSIRGDYIFTWYPNFVKQAQSLVNPSMPFYSLGPIANQTSIKLNTQAVLLSLVYHWVNYYDK